MGNGKAINDSITVNARTIIFQSNRRWEIPIFQRSVLADQSPAKLNHQPTMGTKTERL